MKILLSLLWFGHYYGLELKFRRGQGWKRANDEIQFQLNIMLLYHNICSIAIIRDCPFAGHCKNNNRVVVASSYPVFIIELYDFEPLCKL